MLKRPRAVMLMGSQRFKPTVRLAVKALELNGPVALITAGWQEREHEDGELREHLGLEARNLELAKRAEQVFAEDDELAEAHRKRQQTLRHKQDFYRIRLEYALEANHVIGQRKAPPEVLEEEERAAIAAIQALDVHHLEECTRVHEEYIAAMRPHDRPSVKKHREEILSILNDCDGLAISGGHVASLVNRLFLFGIRRLIKEEHAVIAWSAGAMAISERIVLFHDNPPQGQGAAEILDVGHGLVPGIVCLPQPEQRLNLDNPERMAILAKRFAPAHCVAFPTGSQVMWKDRHWVRSVGAVRINRDGENHPFVEDGATVGEVLSHAPSPGTPGGPPLATPGMEGEP